jgi:sulfopyruvate decarboxylase subunit beta
MRRVEALRAVADLTSPDDLFICSIGASRDDWWNLRPGAHTENHNSFWPAIMGAVTTTALGLALSLPHRRVVALDTDGSLLMNSGVLCTLANERPANLTVVVMDNEAYEVTGSIPTHTRGGVDLAALARGAGCPNVTTATDVDGLTGALGPLLEDDELGVVIAKIELGRHRWSVDERRFIDGVEDKYRFARHIERLEGIRFVACGAHRGSERRGVAGHSGGQASDGGART